MSSQIIQTKTKKKKKRSRKCHKRNLTQIIKIKEESKNENQNDLKDPVEENEEEKDDEDEDKNKRNENEENDEECQERIKGKNSTDISSGENETDDSHVSNKSKEIDKSIAEEIENEELKEKLKEIKLNEKNEQKNLKHKNILSFNNINQHRKQFNTIHNNNFKYSNNNNSNYYSNNNNYNNKYYYNNTIINNKINNNVIIKKTKPQALGPEQQKELLSRANKYCSAILINMSIFKRYCLYSQCSLTQMQLLIKSLENQKKNILTEMFVYHQYYRIMDFIKRKNQPEKKLPSSENDEVEDEEEEIKHPYFFSNHREEIQVNNVLSFIEGVFAEENLKIDFYLLQMLNRDGYASLKELPNHPLLKQCKVSEKQLINVFMDHRENDITETVETFDDIIIRNINWVNIKKKIPKINEVFNRTMKLTGDIIQMQINYLIKNQNNIINQQNNICAQYRMSLEQNIKGFNNINKISGFNYNKINSIINNKNNLNTIKKTKTAKKAEIKKPLNLKQLLSQKSVKKNKNKKVSDKN